MENIVYDPEKIGLLILSGGLGSRMDYQNKGLVSFNGKPMIQHLLDKFGNLGYLAISANKDIETYKNFNVPVFSDDPEWQDIGPLGGIISLIKHFPENLEAILVVPCDTPLLPENLPEKLADTLFSNSQNMVVYAKTENMIHPSIFLFRTSMYQTLCPHLQKKTSYSLKSWLFSQPNCGVFFEDETAFTNINDTKTLFSLMK